MTDSPVVGSASWELRATRDKLKQDLRDSETDVKQAVGAMERDASAGADRVGASFGKMGKAIGVGIAAVAAVAAAGLAIAVQFGQASLKMADDLANSAQRIGIGTAALQEWQYVARKTGEDASAVSGSLETFSNKFASAAAELSKADVKAFAALRLDPEDLRGFKDVEAALDEVVDRIGSLKSESDRAAIAERLGLGPLASALRDGSAEVAKLRDEAQALGFVMDEDLIRKGSEAQGQMEDLAQVIGIQLAGAFIELSDEVLTFTSYIADALRGLNAFIERAQTWKTRVDAMYGDGVTAGMKEGGVMGPLRAIGSAVGSVVSGRTFRAAADIRAGNSLADYANPIDANAVAAFGVSPPSPRTPRNDFADTLSIPPGRTRTNNSAQRAAEREARRAERVEQEIFRARQRLLRVAEDDILTAQQRYDIAREQLKMDREARDAEIQSKTDRGEIKAAERRQLDAANASADALEDRLLTDNAFREIQDERLATEKLLSGLTADLLSLQSGAARTAKERQRIELDLLEITQRQRREALRLELDRNPSLTQAQRDGAMSTNGRIERAERDAVIRNNLSPLQAWRDESLKTADEIREAYENVGARGLDALNSGIVDAIINTKSLGETFSSVAKQILADLLSISVRRGITEPLADMLFGGSGSGSGGGIGSSIFSAIKSALKIPGFSSGVSNFGGGLAYVHAGEILANLPQGTDVIPAHAVQAMGSKGSVSRVVVTTNDDRFNAYVDDRAARPAAAAFSTARKAVPSDMARTDRYTLGRRR